MFFLSSNSHVTATALTQLTAAFQALSGGEYFRLVRLPSWRRFSLQQRLLVAVGFLADSALSALESVGAQRILPRKNSGQNSAQLISSRAAIRSPLSIKNAVRQKTIPRKPWALILLDLLVSFGGTQLWHLTLACLSFTVFVGPLVADMVCQAHIGLAYPPGLPLSPRGSEDHWIWR